MSRGAVIFVPRGGFHQCLQPATPEFPLGTRWRCECGRVWELELNRQDRKQWTLVIDYACACLGEPGWQE